MRTLFRLAGNDVTSSVISSQITESVDNIFVRGSLILEINKRNNELSKLGGSLELSIEFNHKNKKKIRKFVVTGLMFSTKEGSDKSNGTLGIQFVDISSFKLLTKVNSTFLKGKTCDMIKTLLGDIDINTCNGSINQGEYLTPSTKTHGESLRKIVDEDDTIIGYMDIDGVFNVINMKSILDYNRTDKMPDVNLNTGSYKVSFGSRYDFFKFFNNGAFGYKTTHWDKKEKDYYYNTYSSGGGAHINPPIFNKSVTRTSVFNSNNIRFVDIGTFEHKLMKHFNIIKDNDTSKYHIIKLVHMFDRNTEWSIELTCF